MFENRKINLLVLILSISLTLCAFAQTEWTKYFDNPVMVKDTTLPGCWEWAAIGQPSLLFENDTIKMWYGAAGVSGIGDTVVRGRISYAYSIDGVNWIKQNPPTPVLNVGAPGTWDARWLDTPAILRDDTEYKLYYYGDSGWVFVSAIGLATSPDGIVWTKYGSNPVIQKSDSILDWDGLWIESPAVLYDADADTYRMWYTGVAWDTLMPYDQHIQIGYAVSGDGINWVKDTVNNPVFKTGVPGSWDDAWVAVPAVRKIGSMYEMWYCGVSLADWQADSALDTARVGYAISDNGIDWARYPINPVLSNFDLPQDSSGPWALDVVFDGIEYKMLYEAIGPTGNWICLATAPVSGIAEIDMQSNTMLQVFPNPFSDIAYVKFQIPSTKLQTNSKFQTTLRIYDALGRLVKDVSLSTSDFSLLTSLSWDGTDDCGASLPSGAYFILLRQGSEVVQANKVLFLR